MGMLGMLCIAPAVLLIWTPVHNSKKTHSQSNLQQQQRQKECKETDLFISFIYYNLQSGLLSLLLF